MEQLIKALLAFVLILVLTMTRRVRLGYAMIIGAVTLGILILPLESFSPNVVETLLSPLTLELVSASVLIMLMGLIYKETDWLNSMAKGLEGLVPNPKFISMAVPAIFGLLSVPGGALLSAPIVDEEGKRLKLSSAKRTFINVWFRHLVFLIYPLSTTMILISILTGVSIEALVIRQFPIFLFGIALGYFIGFRGVKDVNVNPAQNRGGSAKLFFKTISPIVLSIALMVVFKIELALSIFAGFIALIIMTRINSSKILRIATKSEVYNVALASFGAVLLRNTIMKSGISEKAALMIVSLNVPPQLIYAFLPMLLGLIMAVPSGAVILAVTMLTGGGGVAAAYASLIYVSSLVGYITAPSHLCLVLSAEYHKASLYEAIKYTALGVVITLGLAILIPVLT